MLIKRIVVPNADVDGRDNRAEWIKERRAELAMRTDAEANMMRVFAVAFEEVRAASNKCVAIGARIGRSVAAGSRIR